MEINNFNWISDVRPKNQLKQIQKPSVAVFIHGRLEQMRSGGQISDNKLAPVSMATECFKM